LNSREFRFRSILTSFFRLPVYIPELCHNYRFPADVWLKACVLPSVLHRVNFMLLAENLRVAFAKHVPFPLARSTGPLPIDKEQYVIDKMNKAKKNDSKMSFYLNNYQAAVEDSDDENEMGGYRTQNRSIVYPNPEETSAKPIDRQLHSLCDMVQTVWSVDEEPIDMERHWDNVYPIEIQNYVQFLLRDFVDLSIAERGDARLVPGGGSGGSSAFNRPGVPGVIHTKAICGDPRRYDIQLLTMTGLLIEQKNMLRALTTATSGDVFDMERFEVLGDAFLKFIVSFYLIQEHQDWHEGYLTTVKGQIVSNRNLYYCGVELGLPGMIKVARFAPKDDWLPPNLGVPKRARELLKKEQKSASILYKLTLSDQEQRGQPISEQTYLKFEQQVMNQPKLSNRDTQMQVFLLEQSVADKTVADTMEALLGVCVDSLGIRKAAKFLTLFQILPDRVDLSTLLDRKLKSKRMCADADDEEIDDLLINYQDLEKALGYRFTDRAYLLQALTHASYPTNRITGCYQQLEFLGDAVLDFLISAYIFERCPNMDPGQLTDLRSALVNNVTLACICVRNQFHLHILAQNAQLAETISKFCQFQENHQHKITDQVDLLVTESDRDTGASMADYVDVPKVLGDVFESLIGAVFLDSYNNLNSCWTVIQRLMRNELDEFSRNVPIQLIRRLFEFPGANPKFDDPVVDDDVVMVALRFTCRNEILKVSGFGQNKSDAQKAAAKVALQHLCAVV
jgi:endoribonuclease Dicer